VKNIEIIVEKHPEVYILLCSLSPPPIESVVIPNG